MDTKAVSEVIAFTGLDESSARSFLEMAGGNVKVAVGLCFGDDGENEGVKVDRPSESTTRSWGPSYVDGVVVSRGESHKLGDCVNWVGQGFEFSQVGLVQKMNGPCGVLAAVNAVLLAIRLRNAGSIVLLHDSFSDSELAFVLARMVLACASENTNSVTLCSWRNGDVSSGEVVSNSVSKLSVEQAVLDSIYAFSNPGGLLLLIFSCVETRGVDNLKADVSGSGGELPLLVGPNHLCTLELLQLLLCGRASGTINAYSIMGCKSPALPTLEGVGLLSLSEQDSGIPVRDELKSPDQPVWILHSHDHFTVMFETSNTSASASTYQPPLKIAHFNGLPPAGPRMCELEITGDFVAGAAPAQHKEVYFKPMVGEIEDIVQANSEDKSAWPDYWTNWRYECVLAVDDPSVQGPERPADLPHPKIFAQDSKGPAPDASKEWRCSSCYRMRFQTMCFGQNAPGTKVCVHCSLPQSQACWTLWLSFDELPSEWQRKMSARHAPPIVPLLQTKWPNCKVKLLSSSTPDNTKLPSV